MRMKMLGSREHAVPRRRDELTVDQTDGNISSVDAFHGDGDVVDDDVEHQTHPTGMESVREEFEVFGRPKVVVQLWWNEDGVMSGPYLRKTGTKRIAGRTAKIFTPVTVISVFNVLYHRRNPDGIKSHSLRDTIRLSALVAAAMGKAPEPTWM
jgi:hypothetical protein